MTRPSFGDRVRIGSSPESEASGFAGRVGEVWSESEPSVSGVGPVIGDRGDDVAVSVLFEDTEDVVWFAPHLVRRVERARSPSRRLLLVFFAALALATATAVAGVGKARIRSLALVGAAPPCFPAQGYVTAGAYPNVRGTSKRAARANIALRRAVIADQRSYARTALRRAASRAGIYEMGIDQELTSASTVVVSALIPALELHPGGGAGQTWIAATVDVRSGKAVSLRQLLANPPLALPVLAADWKARLRHTTLWPYVAQDTAGYTPSFAHYRYFALTPTGLAFGFRQEPGGSRFAAVIPYRLVRPYLSPLGRRLVAGVRRPRTPRAQEQGGTVWAGLGRSVPRVETGWPTACT
ncbi:MAG TPA: hypothetical protein VE984_01540 [Gaiellaceae bacterium]|nr:hypothetical protein [Gaiellaceae bacterium]